LFSGHRALTGQKGTLGQSAALAKQSPNPLPDWGDCASHPCTAPHPAIYVGVTSLDATIKKVQAAGGKVITPITPIPDMGAYARVADTEGNVIGLFQSQA